MIRIERKPRPSLEALRGALSALASKALVGAKPDSLSGRDPAFIEAVRPLLGLSYDAYFRCETELESELPDGPVLAVANHNGMSGTPDMFCHMVAYWRRYGSDDEAYGLMHDVPFMLPGAGAWLNACGAVRACRDNAHAALDRGAKVLVFPGGDLDACKPYSKRYQIDFAGRRGFVEVAIRAGVPIVPIVSVGAHSSLYLYSDGRRIAEALGLPRSRFRSHVFPIGLALPYGFIFGNSLPHLPPPVKIHTRFMAPIELDLPPEAADDPATVAEVYAHVVAVMQGTLDELRRAGRHGLFPRRASEGYKDL